MLVSSANSPSSPSGARPEDAVARRDQRPLGRLQEFERALDLRRIPGRPQVVRRVHLRAAPLLARIVAVVENVGWDLDERRSLRRRRGLAERLTQVDSDRRPVENAFGEFRERAANLRAVRFLERPELILGRGMLPGDAYNRTAGEPGAAEPSHGVGEPAPRRHAADARGTAGPRVGVGGIGTCLLVTHVDELDAVLAEGRENRKGMTAVDREQVFDALRLEDARDQLAAVDPLRRLLLACRSLTVIQRLIRFLTLRHDGLLGLG